MYGVIMKNFKTSVSTLFFCVMIITTWSCNSPSSHPASSSIAIGLVAYYPFDGSANDESGHGFNGTVNGATLTTDRFGKADKAYYFNGSSGISSTVDTTLSLTEFTMAAWFESDTAINARIVTVTRPTQCNCYYGILYNNNNNLETMLLTDSTSTIGYKLSHSRSAPGSGSWHHGAITYSNGVLKIYVDGAFDDSATSMAPLETQFRSSAALQIGFCPAGGRFIGKLDNIRIYNRVLSDAEIAAVYSLSD
jgi:hypothetical protein